MSSRLGMVEASYTGLVRRMVNLPRAISRAMDQGLDLMRVGGGARRNRHQFPPPNVPVHHHHHPPLDQSVVTGDPQPDWVFLVSFEQQFGIVHPFFYACRFQEAVKMAQEEHKFVFLYLHSPDHPFTPSFCKDTLCSEVVVQFLDANFVSWGGIADRGEGLHMAMTLQPASFPFCAVIAPGPADGLAVVQQMEGPVSPAELVEMLQRTLEEHGSAFGQGRAKDEQKRRADLRLRQEQDAAYFSSLRVDQEKEKLKSLAPKVSKLEKKPQHQDTQVLIRFPNGERKENKFSSIDKVEAVFKFIDSLGLPGVDGNYRVVSSFPRKVYGIDQMGMTLKDAGFHPKATLFIELD